MKTIKFFLVVFVLSFALQACKSSKCGCPTYKGEVEQIGKRVQC